jgi:pSer/pThr/pTyr-binding forkhead associated (FHA) protein
MTDASVVIREGAGAGSEHPLNGELTVGREQGAGLVVDDGGVSRLHARFVDEGGAIVVEDLGSSNGTFVNGEQISGPVELGAGDEVQVGGTVLEVQGVDAATAMIPPGADATEEHPGPAPRRPAPSQPSPGRRPAPGRLAPHPQQDTNIPALAAVFLGPLSIFLILFSTGAAFFVSLPCAIAAIVLGTVGMRNVDQGKAEGFRGLAQIGRITGIIGTVLSVLALIAFFIVSVALDTTERSLDGIVDRVREEIEGVDVPSAPDVNAPDQGGDSGGVEAP